MPNKTAEAPSAKRKSNKSSSAAHVLAGFRYQLLQSLAAWMELRNGEELWLEVSEDFSIAAEHSSTDVQVKSSQAASGPRSFSLQSAEIIEVLRRFWERSYEGSAERRLIFLAQGGPARERDYAFPGEVPGLRYWRTAAFDGDTAPLRAALAALFNREPLGTWLATEPPDEEFRARLLRRVNWALEAVSSDGLSLQLRDQVGALFHAKNLPVLAANQAVSALLERALETAAKPRPEDRRLGQIELHRVIEETVAVIGLGQRMAAPPTVDVGTPHSLLVAELDLPAVGFSPRTETVAQALDRAKGQPVLWVYGSHGVGKSTLARLLAQQIGGRWLTVDLRPVQKDEQSSLAAWRELVRVLATANPPDGVIVDDYADAAVVALRPRLAALAHVLSARGARLIITSPQTPSPARLLEFGAAANAAIGAPYFTEGEVADLVRVAPAPPDGMTNAWTLFIRIATGGGHPLLTAAKVSSLRARNWPVDALTEDLGGSTSEAVRTTRDDARQVLLRELSALDAARSLEAGQVLRRIASVFDRVDDSLARRLSAAVPALVNAGDALAVLRGTWLELLPGGDLRVSPLLGDITSDVPPEDGRRWRRLAAEHWLSTRVLDERTLPLCFWNAFWGEHDWVLLKLCQVLQTLPRERLRGAASLLSPMTAFVTERPLYPSSPAVAAHLRLLQFEVADAIERSQLGTSIASRLLQEIDELPHDDVKALLTNIAAPKVLLAEFAEVSARDRIDYALRARAAMPRVLELSQGEIADPAAGLVAEFGANIDLAGFLFAGVIRRLRGSQDMLELVQALDSVQASERNGFIEAMSTIYGGHSVFVHSGWSRDQLENRDMAAALQCYQQIETIVRNWGRPDLMLELACARSVILDEGLNRTDDAITAIDAATDRFGEQPPLLRQKSKVLAHAERHADAADLLLRIEGVIGLDSPFDRALALRDGGLSAAHAGRFADAVRLLDKAEQALRGDQQKKALATGILVEKGLAYWESGQRSNAILALADALDALETFPPSQSRQAERAHQLTRATIGLFMHDLDSFPSIPRPAISFGHASALAGENEELLNLDLKPLADNWRILAIVEAEADVDVGIECRSAAKQQGPALASIEHLLCAARYSRALRSFSIIDALRAGVTTASVAKMAQAVIGGNRPMARIDRAELFSTTLESLIEEPDWREAILRLPLDAILHRSAIQPVDPPFLDELRRACADVFGTDELADSVLKAASGLYAVGPAAPLAVATAGALAITQEEVADAPSVRFYRDMMITAHVAQSFARRLLEPNVVQSIATGWTMVLERQKFRLRNPERHCPAVEAAISSMSASGLKGAAQLILAAAPAVNHDFGVGWEELLKRVAGTRAGG